MNKRSERLDELLDVFDKGYSLCAQYDEIPHQYGEEVLYQSEMHFLQAVGKYRRHNNNHNLAAVRENHKRMFSDGTKIKKEKPD